MVQLGSEILDLSFIPTFTLLMCRFAGIFLSLPGIGTEQVSPSFRFWASSVIAGIVTMTGVRAPESENYAELMIMLGSEITLGYMIGIVPSFILGGLAVAGQVISGSIGLGQANMMDRSLGGNIAIIARMKIMVATAVFLLMDGHHAVLRMASGIPGEVGLSLFRIDMDTVALLTDRLSASFELALVVAAPVLVTTLITQFVLGLITKFVPQVNIFIISLPLSVMVGLYIMEYAFPGIARHTVREFGMIEEVIAGLFPPAGGG